jgi:DNA primase
MSDIDEVKSRVNIVDIIGEKVRLKKAGVNYFGLCPFHNEKSPSFSVNENLQIFKCFGCGASGDAFGFLMKFENASFGDVLKDLAEKVGYKLQNSSYPKDDKIEVERKRLYELNKLTADYYKKELLKKENPGFQYAEKRNLNEELINNFGIGYASQSSQNLITKLEQMDYKSKYLIDSGLAVQKEARVVDKFRERLIFSVFDTKGNIVGFSGRYIGEDRKEYTPPRYLNSPETLVFNKSRSLFGLYQASEAIRKLKFVILTEGQMNVISSHRVGVRNIVASLGTSFTSSHLEILRRFTSTIYIAFDKDTAGKKATLRTLEMIFSSNLDINVKVLSWDSTLGKDPDEVIVANHKYWIESVNNPIDPIEYFIHEFEKKFPDASMDNRSALLNTIVPLVLKIKNLIKRDEYLKFIANYFDINIDSINSTFKVQEEKIEEFENTNIKINTNSISDLLFAIFLQNWSSTKGLLIGIDRDYILEDQLELFDLLSTFVDSEDIKEVYDQVDEATANAYQELSLKRLDLDDSMTAEEHILKNIPMLLRIKYKEITDLLALDPDNDELNQKRNKIMSALSEYSHSAIKK